MMTDQRTTLRCKEILLRKLSFAVCSSVLSQVIILLVFVFISNFNIIHPVLWWQQTMRTVMSLSTWFFVIPFAAMIFAQSVICSKDYVVCPTYCTTRIQKLFCVFSANNLFSLVLHALSGGLIVWIYLSISSGEFVSVVGACDDSENCLNRKTCFLAANGVFTGVYFFTRICRIDRNMQFPVIQQWKVLQVKSKLVPLMKESKNESFWPTLYFVTLYYMWGDSFESNLVNYYETQGIAQTGLINLAMYAWLFNTLYMFSMNIMHFFFVLYLTESIEFPLAFHSGQTLKLQDAINMNNLPIIQNLACLDLYLLSYWSPLRRQILFSVSQPGGHPHNWDALVQNVLKLFSDYTQLINKSVDMIVPPEQPKEIKPTVKLPPTSPYDYSKLRNMSLYANESLDIINVSHAEISSKALMSEHVSKTIESKLKVLKTTLKHKLGYNFLFDELPTAYIRKCLGYGQIIVWTTQGMASIAVASIKEDRYGVVQKDLPVLITALLGLKQCLDKLNKVPAFTKRVAGSDNFNYRMKLALTSAVKRSLVNICSTFGDYLKDFPLSKETLQQLSCYVPVK